MAVVGSDMMKGSDSAMERFGTGGMALLPWTRHLLSVLWEQLRLLVQVIYYTFVSVFQMFRFEVHVRITDETGHVSAASTPNESFLFSSLFDGDGGVMVGSSVGKAEALLSSLHADIVDDFVSRTAGEDAVFVGHQSSWRMGFPGDWNIFVSSSDGLSSDGCHKNQNAKCPKRDEEDRSSSHWSSEDDQSLDDDSKALWESLSRSSDPYNPLFFSACISTNARAKDEASSEEPPGMWVSRSDSETSWSSWTGSDCSAPDVDREESERLWELFSRPEDPYNPMSFSASTGSKDQDLGSGPEKALTLSEDHEEEHLWRSLCPDDLYHPLNFQTRLQTSTADPPETSGTTNKTTKPPLTKRLVQHHCHQDMTWVYWRRPGLSPHQDAAHKTSSDQKKTSRESQKVTFSSEVRVHVMRTWRFACWASRKGPWEELARDRERFRRRIQDTERSIGHCLTAEHRERMWSLRERGLEPKHQCLIDM